jgi:hypothetical protein
LRVERLLQRLIAPTQIAGSALALGELCSGCCRVHDLLRELQRLCISDDRVVLRLHRCGHLDDSPCDFERDALGTGLADLPARRQAEHPDEVLHDRQLGGAARVAVIPDQREHRIVQQPGLHEIGLRDAETGVGRLQLSIVEQRDLHRTVDGQLLLQHALHRALDQLFLLRAARPCHVLTEPLARELAHVSHTRVRLRRCTCRECGGCECAQPPSHALNGDGHGLAPARLAAVEPCPRKIDSCRVPKATLQLRRALRGWLGDRSCSAGARLLHSWSTPGKAPGRVHT